MFLVCLQSNTTLCPFPFAIPEDFVGGHMRRTDFLPVGGETDAEVLERGYDSLSDDDEDGRGLEYACEGNSDVFDGQVDIAELVSQPTDCDFQ